MATRRPLIVDDLSTIEVVATTLRESGLRSLVAVPIMSGDRFFGVLHVGSFELHRFTEVDAELLELLAERLALALNRVSLFDEQARLTELWSFFAEATRTLAEVENLAEALGSAGGSRPPGPGRCLSHRRHGRATARWSAWSPSTAIPRAPSS